MHNGTLNDVYELKNNSFKPLGTTDSELAFCYLLHRMKLRKRDMRRAGERGFPGFDFIESVLKDINLLGRFNAVFSDGEYLYVYRDQQ